MRDYGIYHVLVKMNMRSYLVGLEVKILAGPFINQHHIWCVWGQQRLWRDCMDLQASLNPRPRLHIPEVLKYIFSVAIIYLLKIAL